jgi:hypothetical protein
VEFCYKYALKKELIWQVVRASAEAYSPHDVEAIARDFSPDVLDDYMDASRPPVRGVDSFKYNRYQFFKAFPHMKGENLHTVAMVNGQLCGESGVLPGRVILQVRRLLANRFE